MITPESRSPPQLFRGSRLSPERRSRVGQREPGCSPCWSSCHAVWSCTALCCLGCYFSDAWRPLAILWLGRPVPAGVGPGWLGMLEEFGFPRVRSGDDFYVQWKGWTTWVDRSADGRELPALDDFVDD